MAIQFPKLSLELFLMKREAEVSTEITRRYIQWPEILNYDIEFWLAEATKEARKNPGGQVSEALLKLPAVFSSTDKGTWLATRKPEKTQSKANQKWLAQSVSVEDKPCANPASQRLDKSSWLAASAAKQTSAVTPPTVEVSRSAAGQENPLSIWLNKENPPAPSLSVVSSCKQAVKNPWLSGSSSTASLPTVGSCQQAVANPWLSSSYFAGSQSKSSDIDVNTWLAKPTVSSSSSSSTSSSRTEQNKWLSKSGDADISSSYAWVSKESANNLEAVRKGLDKFSFFPASMTTSVTLSESTSVSSVTSWLQRNQVEQEEEEDTTMDLKKWISGDEASEGSIITLDSKSEDTTEDIDTVAEDAVFVDKAELDKWLLHN